MEDIRQEVPDAEKRRRRGAYRDRGRLLEALTRIDREGWNGPTGSALLQELRATMVRPLAIDIGLRGAMASQAEASGWEAVWIALCNPSLRAARSPWGVLWQAARRAVITEILTSRFATNDRRAWELALVAREGAVRVPLSLEALVSRGWDPPSGTPDQAAQLIMHDVCTLARDALVAVGWETSEADAIVAAVMTLTDPTDDPRSTVLGWRSLADALDLPAWQARRLTVALRGTSQWPGLLARLLTDDLDVAGDVGMRSALLATRYHSHRSPVLAAQRATGTIEDHPQRAAG
jgi:hypothetical protein